MNDLLIKLALLRDSLSARMRDEDGAISIEYVGIVAFVAGIVILILQLDIADRVAEFISTKVDEVLNEGG